MKTTKYFTLRKAAGVVAAGKLALGASAASAQTDFSNCGFGKGGEECEPQENEVPPLFLQEFGSPPRILTSPMYWDQGFDWNSIGYDDPFGSSGSSTKELRQSGIGDTLYDNLRIYYGILWCGDIQNMWNFYTIWWNQQRLRQGNSGKTAANTDWTAADTDGSGVLENEELPQCLRHSPFPAEGPPPPRPRVEFLIEGVRNDRPMAVIMAYATKEPTYPAQNRNTWQSLLDGPIRAGQMDLDLETLQVIAGIRLDPESAALGANPPTPLGRIPPMRTRSIKIPVDLSDLNDESLMDNHLFFQAIAVPLDPTGGFIMPESQASEVDHFVIERPDFNNLESDCGSKCCDKDAPGGFKPALTCSDGSTPVDGVCADGSQPSPAEACPDGSPLDPNGKCTGFQPDSTCPDGSPPDPSTGKCN
ncbi:MAG: hypothetical protein GY862_06900 [Gammaproteobacteria bacterium]|nr:hypothetical protein [Gammaproteobacteria bacterium]